MNISERIDLVNQRIEQAAARAGRNRSEITLIAVTKTRPVEVLQEAYDAGLRQFGENRAHELAEKAPAFLDRLGPGHDIVWHFIGHLQTRQSLPVAEHARFFHAADRNKIIKRLAGQVVEKDQPLDVLLEVNISGEENKGGYACAQWEESPEQQAAILEAAKLINGSANLKLAGLMTMAPWQVDEEIIRNVFKRTANLKDWLNQQLDSQLSVLSMGMTDDFEIAIEEGATHIRVGRALFGERS